MYSTSQRDIPELLAPAGNLEKLRIALAYGADAVYLGGLEWGLRARADNFTLSELERGLEEAHAAGRRIYLTLNSFLQEADREPIRQYIPQLNRLQPDALIISDPALLKLLKRETDIPLHVSTQTSCANSAALAFWQELGASRVVMARELTLTDLTQLREATSLELEVFIQGAMCSSWSGKCTISNYLTGSDANRGGCTHPCRWEYDLEQDLEGQVLFSRELNMLSRLPDLLDTGVDSLKIEGRMRSLHYVATATRSYRQALDHIAMRQRQGDEPDLELLQQLAGEVSALGNREQSSGNYFGRGGAESVSRAGAGVTPGLRYIGRRLAGEPGLSWFQVAASYSFSGAEQLEVVSGSRNGQNLSLPVRPDEVTGPLGEPLDRLQPNSVIRITGSFSESTLLQARPLVTGGGAE